MRVSWEGGGVPVERAGAGVSKVRGGGGGGRGGRRGFELGMGTVLEEGALAARLSGVVGETVR